MTYNRSNTTAGCARSPLRRAPPCGHQGTRGLHLRADGRRRATCRPNALPRNWIALDVDRIAPEVHVEWRMHLDAVVRVRMADRLQHTGSAARTGDRGARQGGGLRGRRAARRDAECRCGGELRHRRVDRCEHLWRRAAMFHAAARRADVLHVRRSRWTRRCGWRRRRRPKPPPPPLDEAAAEIADVSMRHLVGQLHDLGLLIAPLHNGQGYAMHCPWVESHSSEGGASATAVLFPADANGWRGGFSCSAQPLPRAPAARSGRPRRRRARIAEGARTCRLIRASAK